MLTTVIYRVHSCYCKTSRDSFKFLSLTGRTIKEAPFEHDFIPQKVAASGVSGIETAYFFSNCCGQRGFPNLTDPNAPAAFTYTGCDHSRSKSGQVHRGFLEYSFSKKDRRGKEQSFAQAACKNESLVEDHVERRSLQENDIRFQQQARVAKLCRTGPDAQASSTSRPLRTRLRWSCCGESEDSKGCTRRSDAKDAEGGTLFLIDASSIKRRVAALVILATLEEYADKNDAAAAQILSDMHKHENDEGLFKSREELVRLATQMAQCGKDYLSNEEPWQAHFELRALLLELLCARVTNDDKEALLLLVQLEILAKQWDARGVRILLDQVERSAIEAHPGLVIDESSTEVFDAIHEASLAKHGKLGARNAMIEERNEVVMRLKR